MSLIEARGRARFAQSKLLRPEVPGWVHVSDAVRRRVGEGIAENPLLLVVGQAGCGKSTAVASALRSLHLSSVETPADSAWISLDAGDDSVAGLVELVAAAVESVVPNACPTVHDLITTDAVATAGPRVAASVLVNDLASIEQMSLVLVLDDVHTLVGRDTLTMLDHLVTYCPPSVRIVMVGRTEPGLSLSRFRSSGRLADVRGDELRLDATAAGRVLNERLGLDLSIDQVDQVVRSVQGWATGVWLLGRSIGHRDDFERIMAADTTDLWLLYDYLAEEIYGAEPAELQDMLSATCVLDELTPAAVASMTTRDDSAALLDLLHQRLSFLVIALDKANSTYRYHHLFVSFLRRRLLTTEPERWRAMHRLAAENATDPSRAVRHYIEGRDWEQAAEGIEQLIRDAVPRGARAHTLAGLVRELPATDQGRPWCQFALGWDASVRGLTPTIIRHLEPILSGVHQPDVLLRLMTTLILHDATNDHQRFEGAFADIERSPDFAALADRLRIRHHVGAAYCCLGRDRWAEAARYVANVFSIAAGADLGESTEAVAEQIGSMLHAVDGAADRIESWSRRVGGGLPTGPSIERLSWHYQRTYLGFVRGRWADVLVDAAAARALIDLYGVAPHGRAGLDLVEANCLFALGELPNAERILTDRLGDAEDNDVAALLNTLQLPLLARVFRANHRVGDVAGLSPWFSARVGSLISAQVGGYIELTFRAQVAWAEGGPAEAVPVLESAVDAEEQVRFVLAVGSARMDLAMALDELGDHRAADDQMSIALKRAARLELPGIVALAGQAAIPLLQRAVARPSDRAMAARVLATLEASIAVQPVSIPGTPIALSRREVEVLRLLGGGTSNRDLAARLHISEHTAKSHVRSVLTKLNVSSRGQAVARARDLRLT